MSQIATPIPEPQPARGPRLGVVVAVVVGALLLVGGVAAANLLFRATRSSFADAMPSNSVAFFHVDLLNLIRSEELGRMVDVFDPEGGGFDAEFELDKLFLDEGYRFDFSNDIVPWVGRGIGVAVMDFEDAGGVPEFVVTVDVRDRGKFEQFFPNLVRTLEEEAELELFEMEYEGVTIYSSLDASFAFSRDTFIIGPDDRAVRRSIDAQTGESLADNPAFGGLVSELPGDRILTGWFHMEGYQNLMDSSLYDPLQADLYNRFFDGSELPSAYAFSADLAEPGVRMDMVTIYPDGSSLLDLVSGFDPATAARAPEDALGYLAVPPFVPLYIEWFADLIDTDFEDQRLSFREEFGIDPITDLAALLDGPMSIVVSRNDFGFLAGEWGVPIDVAGYLGTSDPDRLRENIEILITASGADSVIGPSGDPRLWDYVNEPNAWPFGVDYGQLMAATDRALLEELFVTIGPSLADDATYEEAASQLGTTPWLYVDIGKIIDLVADEEVPAEAAIFDYTAFGYEEEGSLVRGMWILGLDL